MSDGFQVGDPVWIEFPGVARRKGRICFVNPSDSYCVQLEDGNCIRVFGADLSAAEEPAPACSQSCLNGNC